MYMTYLNLQGRPLGSEKKLPSSDSECYSPNHALVCNGKNPVLLFGEASNEDPDGEMSLLYGAIKVTIVVLEEILPRKNRVLRRRDMHPVLPPSR